ncbi:unnamed protein product [Miscanthus lutarioriparius]|uniref:NB-ARC domain-containing protein n=1 Tax=Miscanthus lutarioriparius TaxID=422564 RepID=A0A811Q1Z9_9POAL|nr:unnamed protein product [Miscanthus lutarioriparius]
MAGRGHEDLRRVVEMLRLDRMEEQFRLLRASTLLAELRSAVSLVQTHDTVSSGSSSSLKLIFCVRSLAAPLRDLLEAVLQHTEVGARVRRAAGEEWRQGWPREPMVGRSELLEKMVGTLLSDRTGYRALLMVPIVGGPGVGKTRIAKAILDDARIKHRFPVRLVVPVAQDSCLERILMLMVSPDRRADVTYSLETMAKHIDRKLSGGSYLIVLDDVWSDNEGKWQEIGTVVNTMPSNGVLVLTTRTPDIASKLATMADIPYTIKPFYLHPLGQEFSSSFVDRWIATCHGDWHADELSFLPTLDLQFWQGLFLQDDIGGDNRIIHPDMFQQELPLCIDLLPSDKFWQRFLAHYSRDEFFPDGNVLLQSASASYQHLPADLQSCFLYCSVFPSDYDFDVEELADLLAADGNIPPVVAKAQRKGFLQQLLDECFYPMHGHEYGDKHTFRMHKVLHIFAQNMDRRFSSILRVHHANQVTDPKVEAQSTIRRSSLIVHPLAASFPRSLLACKDLRALILLQQGPMCPPDQLRCEITEIPQEFLQSFKSMHTLSLIATKIRILPAKFIQPHHMKYLNLSQTDIENIPSAISRFPFLQTLILSYCDKLQKLHPNTTKLTLLQKLDLEGCCNLIELPRDMSKMKSLEYLNVTECSSLTQLPCGMGQLKSLQMLLGYIVSYTDGSSMSELQPLANLHRLSLQSLEKLESFSIRWNMDGTNNTTLAYAVLESLRPHRCLKALEIVAYEGNYLPSWMTSTEPYLEFLVEVKLINLRSCETLLPSLGLLPCLKIAEISGAETVCSVSANIYGHRGAFRSLEKLTFSYMHNLEVWEQAQWSGMFPRLAELAIIQCPKMRALHMELPSLEKLILWMNNKVLYNQKGTLQGVAKTLEHISISFGEELLASSGCEALQDLDELTKLEICGCEELTCLPQGLQRLSSMRSLTIDNCRRLEALPDWLENLPSLQIIRLSGCPLLHYIPRGLQQRPGVIIYVEDCPNLIQDHLPNFSAQSSGEPVGARVNKGKEIVQD